MVRRHGAWLGPGLGLVLGLLGCDREPPPKAGLEGWPAGEAIEVGACLFVLSQATLWHSSEWHLEVRLSVEGIGTQAEHCGYSVQAVTQPGTALTRVASGGSSVAPGQVREIMAQAREAAETGLSSGPAEDAWVYVAVSEGRWPLATTREAFVTPGRERPPP